MAERSNAAVLKTVVPLREPGVRIPFSPRLRCVIGCKRECETNKHWIKQKNHSNLKIAVVFLFLAIYTVSIRIETDYQILTYCHSTKKGNRIIDSLFLWEQQDSNL